MQSLTSQLEQFWNGFSNNWMVMKLRTWQTKFWTNWSTESLMVMELFIVSTVEKFTMAWNSFWCTILFTFVFAISLILCNISAQKVLNDRWKLECLEWFHRIFRAPIEYWKISICLKKSSLLPFALMLELYYFSNWKKNQTLIIISDNFWTN